jgi:hypothetical protein
MRSSVSKSAWEGAMGPRQPVISLKRAPKVDTHQYVGVFLTSTQL